MIFPIGEPNTTYAKYFSGSSYLAPISTEQIPFFNVTFERAVVTTGISTRQKEGRADARGRCRTRLVSGGRETGG